jgi:hypothetical protein
LLTLGNLGTIGLEKTSPLCCNRPFPWNWLIYLPLLILSTIPIYVIATVLVYCVTPHLDLSLWYPMRYGWKIPVLVVTQFHPRRIRKIIDNSLPPL